MKQFSIIFILWALLSLSACVDSGVAQGTLKLGDKTVPLSYAIAELHDNAEGVLDHPHVMRIVLADREIPKETLNGLVFLPIENMAKVGKVRGLMFEFDPDKATSDTMKATVTYLDATEPNGFLATSSYSGPGFFKEYKLIDGRVTATMEEGGDTGYKVTFNAPVFKEPAITADLKGAQADNSPQMAVLQARLSAMEKGDLATVKALSTSQYNEKTAAILADPQAVEMFKAGGKQVRGTLKGGYRLVERGDRAVLLIFSTKGWEVFAKENGEWKSDD